MIGSARTALPITRKESRESQGAWEDCSRAWAMSAMRPPASGHGGGEGELAEVKTDLARARGPGGQGARNAWRSGPA